MNILCTSCHLALGKIIGDKVILSNGTLISGENYDILIKCNCGELANVSLKDGIIKSNGNEINPNQNNGSSNEPKSTDGNERGGKNGDSGEPNGDDGTGAGEGQDGTGANGHGPENTPSGESEQESKEKPELPTVPKSWIRR